MDHNASGSSVHRVLQARPLEWVAIAFSGRLGRRPEKGRGRPGDETNTQVMPIGFVIESVSPKHIDTLPTPPPGMGKGTCFLLSLLPGAARVPVKPCLNSSSGLLTISD